MGEGGGKCDYLNHLLRAIFSLKASENMHTYTQINTCIFDNYVDPKRTELRCLEVGR